MKQSTQIPEINKPSSRKIFRSNEMWVLSISSLLMLVFVGYLFFRGEPELVLCLPIVVLASLVGLTFTWQTRIELTHQEFYAQKGPRARLRLCWDEILMAERVHQGRKVDLLKLGTREGVYDIDLSTFDASAVWEELQKHVPPTALDDEAYKSLPAYQNWQREQERLLNTIVAPLKVKYSLGTRAVMFVALFAVVIIGLVIFNSIETIFTRPASLLFWGFLVIGIGLGFIASLTIKLEMTSQQVTFTNLRKKETIDWNEVTAVEHNPRKRRLIFHTKEKNLAVIRPTVWHGHDKEEMLNMLRAQIEHRNIQWIE